MGYGVEVRVLGPIEAANGKGPIDLGTRMHRTVLALLAMHVGRVVSSDRLVDGLWGGHPPATAMTALHVYVSHLRKGLEPDRAARASAEILVTQAPGYALRVGDDDIDAVRFETLVGQGDKLLGAGKAAEAYDVLDRALKLWRGSAYEDLAFEPSLQTEIARLHELRATATEARLEAKLAAGLHADAIVDAEGMVSAEPLRERRWALLALALYQAGRQAEALRTLDRARRTLAEELGLDPGPELRRLEQDILVQSPELELRRAGRDPGSAGRRVPLLLASPNVSPVRPPPAPGGAVLPASATPHGFSLLDMARLVVPFTARGYDPAWAPDTPIQLLYVEAVDLRPVGKGLAASGTNSFTAAKGAYFYVPLWISNDEPPVLGEFPSDPDAGAAYLFDPQGHGARDLEIEVDGVATAIGPERVVGPFRRSDHWSHVLVLSAFLAPLEVGIHTVRMQGGCFGSGMPGAYGSSFVCEDFTYTVEVLDKGDPAD